MYFSLMLSRADLTEYKTNANHFGNKGRKMSEDTLCTSGGGGTSIVPVSTEDAWLCIRWPNATTFCMLRAHNMQKNNNEGTSAQFLFF